MYLIIVPLIIFLFVLFLQRFTTVNLNLAKSSTDIPYLSQPVQNDTYKIERVTQNTWNEIRYDPVNDFYLIAQNEKITKLNNKGEVTFSLNLNEKDINNTPDFMDYHRPSHFVISWYGIYDLSKEKPYLEKFETQLNTDGKMEWEEWIKRFENLYNTAETVLWGYRKALDASMSHPLYFKINGNWTVLYTLKNVSQINSNDTFIQFRPNYKQDYVQDKFQKLYLLKDVKNGGAFSDYNSFNNTYTNSDYAEEKMEYGKEANLGTISFKKEVYNEVPYSFLPAQFGGTAVNKLSIGNSTLTFKTKAIKGAGFSSEPLKNYIYLFTVPTKFKTENTLSFLYYKYPTNWNSGASEGVYIIKKRAK